VGTAADPGLEDVWITRMDDTLHLAANPQNPEQPE